MYNYELYNYFTFRDDGLSVILYDTSGKDDVNINDLILKTVSAEAESSLLVASQTVSPAGSVSSIPDKVKPDSAKSFQQSSPALPRKNISSPKPSSKDSTPKTSPGSSSSAKDEKAVISKQNVSSKTLSASKQTNQTKKLTSDTSKVLGYNKNPAAKSSTKVGQAQEEIEEGSDSWETESEEEFVEQECEDDGVKMDHNSNLKFTSIDEICDSIDSKCKIIKKSPSPPPSSSSSDATSLYTWSKNSTSQNDEEYDDSKLWITEEYHKFHLPVVFSVPPIGEFCDIHVSFVFDPTNFVVSLSNLFIYLLHFYCKKLKNLKARTIHISCEYSKIKKNSNCKTCQQTINVKVILKMPKLLRKGR